MTRAPQCRGDALVEHPTHRQVNDALAEALLGEPVELSDGGHILSKSRLDEFRVSAPEIVTIEHCAWLHSSGQQPTAQRSISEHRNLVFAAIGKKVGLDSAFEQIVGRLQHVKRRNLAKSLHLKHRKVAHTDGTNLSLLEQCVHGFRGFFDRNQWVGPMNLIDVYVIGSKPSQRIFNFLHDAGAAGIARYSSTFPLQSG